MYMQAAGFGRYPRGLGAEIGPGTLNCPGDPGCPGNPIRLPGTDVSVDVTGSSPAMFYDSTGQYIGSAGWSLTSFLNQNAVPLALGGAALFFLAMAVKR